MKYLSYHKIPGVDISINDNHKINDWIPTMANLDVSTFPDILHNLTFFISLELRSILVCIVATWTW